MRGLLTLGVFLAGLVLGPVPGEAEGPLIESLQIRGTRRPLEMETRAGQTLDLARIERDVHRLRATGWFDDIRVDSSEPTPGLQLTFTLVERPRLYLRRVVFQPARERRPLDLGKRASVDVVLARRRGRSIQSAAGVKAD
jgi:surface antigen-like variable number repeat protein